jgi:hypothetical protein
VLHITDSVNPMIGISSYRKCWLQSCSRMYICIVCVYFDSNESSLTKRLSLLGHFAKVEITYDFYFIASNLLY